MWAVAHFRNSSAEGLKEGFGLEIERWKGGKGWWEGNLRGDGEGVKGGRAVERGKKSQTRL